MLEIKIEIAFVNVIISEHTSTRSDPQGRGAKPKNVLRPGPPVKVDSSFPDLGQNQCKSGFPEKRV